MAVTEHYEADLLLPYSGLLVFWHLTHLSAFSCIYFILGTIFNRRMLSFVFLMANLGYLEGNHVGTETRLVIFGLANHVT